MIERTSQASLTQGPPRLVRLTPPGRGAVAVLRLEGAGALEAVAPYFLRRDDDASAAHGLREVGRVRYGKWRREPGRVDAPAEDVVLCQVEPNVVEIHCHGGDAAPAAIVASLVDDGRAVLEETRDAIDREFPERWRRTAFVQLQRATAPVAARILWDQFQGAWPRLIERHRTRIDASSSEGSVAEIRAPLERTLGFGELGRRLVEPWRIVLAGPPNVGKSSLINRLVGYERSIAFDEPGTTRDVLIVRSVLAGLPVEFSDTAGLREAVDELESEGIARTRAALARADLALLLADASEPWTTEHDAILAASPSAIVVHHKCDLVESIPDDRPPGIAVSSLNGAGIDALLERIVRIIMPCSPEPGEAIPIDDNQVATLRNLLAACERGIEALRATLDSST